MTTTPVGVGATPSQIGNGASRGRARPRWMKLAAFALALVAAGYLARQVVSIAVAKDQAATDPYTALAWRPHDSTALEGAGERLLSSAKTPAEVVAVHDLARRALDRSPLEVGAVRLLALTAQRQGDENRAAQLMTIAGQRSARDGPAQAWLFDYWFKRRDWPRAFAHVDLLLRTHPQVTKQLAPVLMDAVVNDPAARKALTVRLEGAPFWRVEFLSSLAQSGADPSPLLAILTDLNRANAKLSDTELEEVLVPLVNRHLYDEAYLTWTQSLPPKALSALGNIYDADFDGLPGAAPFNWVLHQPNGGAVEITAAPSGARRRALAVHLYDPPTQPLAVQLINLPPGRYVLSARSLSDGGGATGLSWTVRCDGGAVIARLSPAGRAGIWTGGSAAFETPQSGCSAQWLELIAEPGATFQGSGVWWDKLAIDREAP
jgi:hypothetical protein